MTPSASTRREQLLDPQLLGPDALDRRDRALQHVVAAAELVGALDRDDVARLLDDAERRGVAPFVEAVAAQLALGDVEAAPAPVTRSLASMIARGEAVGVLGRGLQEVERDPLRRLRADAGQPPELVDERLDRPFVRAAHASAEQPAEAAERRRGRDRR